MKPSRDRRGKDKVDVESLEHENDRSLDGLGDRVALLKAASSKINGEVESQHNLLDNMDGSFFSTRALLGSVTDKFKGIMSDKNSRQLVYGVAAAAALLLLLYYFMMR